MINPFSRATGALLCLAVISLLVACAKNDVSPADVEKQAFEDWRTDIREVITDPAREAEAIRLVGVLEKDLAELRTSVGARNKRVRELNANYDTPRAEFEAFLADIAVEIRDKKQRVTATQREFLANVTTEERSAIAKTYTKAMNMAIKTIRSM